jgi:hypothetical protein
VIDMLEERSASGKLELHYKFEESASGNWDICSKQVLTGDGDDVILTEEFRSSDTYKISGCSHRLRRTKLSVRTLVRLIRENGEMVSSE